MGQAPSTPELPEEWNTILPDITRDDIVQSFKTKCRLTDDDDDDVASDANEGDSPMGKHSNNNSINTSDKSQKSIYIHDELFDLDDYVPMALEILRSYPHLKDIRFKLVPGKMMEEHFWAGVFGILKDGGLDVPDGVVEMGDIGDDYQPGDEMIDNPNHGAEGGIDHLPSSAAQSPEEDAAEQEREKRVTDDYIQSDNYVIREQGLLIASLQKSLREANHKIRKIGMELHKERKARAAEQSKDKPGSGDDDPKHSGSIATCPKCNTPQTSSEARPHKGQWEMHPDCHEFLKLDDHLKENLRKEKEKRMKEVLSQMKFILDSEELKDSYGKWSCCGKEEYDANGCS